MIRQVMRKERENHSTSKQTHRQNVKKVIESKMKDSVKRILNDERAQSLRCVDIKNLQKASQIS